MNLIKNWSEQGYALGKPEMCGLDENLLSFQNAGVSAKCDLYFLFFHSLIINLLIIHFHFIHSHSSSFFSGGSVIAQSI